MYLVDRKFSFFRANIAFLPTRSSSSAQENDNGVVHLLDGELVKDKPTIGPERLRYLVFDALVVSGQTILHWPFEARLKHVNSVVVRPLRYWRSKPRCS